MNVTNILVGVVIVGLLIARQLRPRQAREDSALRFMLILGGIGIVETVGGFRGQHIGAEPVGLIVLSLLMGAGFGLLRGRTIRVWRDAAGVAWQAGTVLTAVLWIVSLGAHLALDVAVDHSSGVSGLGTATLLLYLAVTLGTQREVVRARIGRAISSGR